MANARNALEKDIDIVKMIRQIRFFNLALNHLLSVEMIKDMKSKSKLISIELPVIDEHEQIEQMYAVQGNSIIKP